MKNLILPLLFICMVVIISCKPATQEEVEEPIPASDMYVTFIQHPVDTFDTWKPFFDDHDSFRVSYGLTNPTVGRDMQDPDMVYIFLRADDVQRAKEFTQLPDLKAVMDSAGVVAAPEISHIHVIRFDSTVNMKDRMLVVHRVKDFDAWLKVYDEETRATRKEHGLVDRGLGRGVDDPNLVYINFGVADMEKAKARATSEDLKNIMMGAGVEGEPKAYWYTVVE